MCLSDKCYSTIKKRVFDIVKTTPSNGILPGFGCKTRGYLRIIPFLCLPLSTNIRSFLIPKRSNLSLSLSLSLFPSLPKRPYDFFSKRSNVFLSSVRKTRPTESTFPSNPAAQLVRNAVSPNGHLLGFRTLPLTTETRQCVKQDRFHGFLIYRRLHFDPNLSQGTS